MPDYAKVATHPDYVTAMTNVYKAIAPFTNQYVYADILAIDRVSFTFAGEPTNMGIRWDEELEDLVLVIEGEVVTDD